MENSWCLSEDKDLEPDRDKKSIGMLCNSREKIPVNSF